MPKDDINYKFTENGIVYDFYDVFVPAENFRQPSLFVWGVNGSGQLGVNDVTPDRFTPITTFSGGTTWKSVSSGGYYIAAIKTDGTLWTWGNNSQGQLGINDTNNRSVPVTTFAGGNNWKSISSGFFQTAAIKTDGTLWIWGLSERGQLGINLNNVNRLTPVTTFAGGNNWKSVFCATRHTAAIKTDGTLWVWGLGNEDGRLGTNDTTQRNTPVTTFAGGNNWKQVSAGYHTAAIKTDGTLWIWGRNVEGQLGTNDTAGRTTPVTTFAGGNTWKSVDCGRFHTAAIKTDGTLWTWGLNTSGELGDNTTTNRSTPVTTFAGGTNWKSVECGDNYTAVIKTDGTLWSWGQEGGGKLGINVSSGSRNTPVTTFAGGNNWKQVSAGRSQTAAIKYSPDP
jgi:alpha-tubulin suppressor-like RCC1 family protein